MGKILIKAVRPNRQKVLTEDGNEIKLQQWANKKAAETLRGAGGDASGEQFNHAREALMRQAVENPEEFGLKFMGERVPFEGQRLEEELSEPDPEGEMAGIDSEFAPDGPMDGEEKDGMLEHMKERSMGGSMVGTPPKTPDVFDAEGKLRQGLKPEEEDEAEAEETPKRQNTPMEQSHPDYWKSEFVARKAGFKDAWGLLKSQ